MFPGITWLLYLVAAYAIWYCISRLALATAWMYAKSGTWSIRHYLLATIGLCPLALEVCSTVLVIFAAAFGITTEQVKEHQL